MVYKDKKIRCRCCCSNSLYTYSYIWSNLLVSFLAGNI